MGENPRAKAPTWKIRRAYWSWRTLSGTVCSAGVRVLRERDDAGAKGVGLRRHDVDA